MQTTRAASALVLALLAVGASAARRSSSSAGLSQAREWLRSHGPAPPQDELQELKGANPEAYAIVKALLTKRALGLLDPRHPTASFAPGRTAEAAPPVSSVDFAASVGVRASSGAAASESSDDAAVEVAPPPAHHSHRDWLSWRPADSAAEDDAQVQQVLGTASQLRAGGVASSAAGVGDAPAPPAAQPAAAQPSAAQPAAATEQTSSYPKGVDLGAPALPDAAAAPKAQGNSYLEGLDLGSPGRAAPEPAPAARQQGLVGVRQAVSQDSGGGDYLRGFSWSDGGGDAAASRPDVDAHPLPPARIVSQDAALPAARVLTSFGGQPEAAASAPAQTTPAPPRKQNALVSWLGSSWGPVQAPPTAERAAASSSGPSAHRGAGRYSQYLRDLTGSS